MVNKNSINTIISRSSVLALNFLIVIFTTQIWGAEGRGEISLLMLNVSLIIIASNIFSGSTIAFHSSKLNKNEIFIISFLGSLLVSIIGSILFSLLYDFAFFKHYFFISFLCSFANSSTLFFLGKKNIKWYNIFLILTPISIIIYLLIIYYGININTIDAFYYANYLAFGTIMLLGLTLIFKNESLLIKKIKLSNLKSIVTYGANNELSSLFQFLNYRLTFYFIAEYLGYHELGVFSVAISISEGLWVISRSTSTLHFSNIINSNNKFKDLNTTTKLANQNFIISILLSILLYLLPNEVFTFIFGDSFNNVKLIILYLLPGIIAIATSNVYGNYFAGIGNLKILKNKSYLGFVATLIFAIILIPKYKFIGACLTINISHIISSLYLFYHFKKNEKNE